MSKINSLLMPFEIGDLFFTTNNTNPSNRFGGTWELYAKGKTIVGIDPDDTDFNSINKTGGSKELQKHSHKLIDSNGANFLGMISTAYSGQTGWNVTNAASTQNGGTLLGANTTNTGTGNSGNLQPYIVSYIWIKTA